MNHQVLIIENSRKLPTLVVTFELEDGKKPQKTLYYHEHKDNGVELLYQPDLGKYTYLGTPVKKINLGHTSEISFTPNNVIYKGLGQKAYTLIRDYNTNTWGLFNTVDLKGINDGGPLRIETIRDANNKKIIKLRSYR
ncbi:hypothetical protein VUJ46_14620 [Chryseobacterium sp. MYb264]|uniref:hypothetical protein n=1 Tax=Chryseobacterium sp. MYb264 TaxID=2745153 RepID=UPI002E15858B|nr:hypothetical protein VUJ46_14620 [Chryseobacterium sp. MYb264]